MHLNIYFEYEYHFLFSFNESFIDDYLTLKYAIK